MIVWNSANKTTIEARGTRAGVGHFQRSATDAGAQTDRGTDFARPRWMACLDLRIRSFGQCQRHMAGPPDASSAIQDVSPAKRLVF